ncbi:AtpZ/AtpI family protein [Anaerosphaera multitolerans]|uniref:AtpZ/AtpI family protein n=2 Tax=Anaerosphaera multitolerans TaxID=2487351 RepID=A0A437S5T8_9FIRM|nr:AtpZ/AtpI family protein [Anaerosphaera multitolerans]
MSRIAFSIVFSIIIGFITGNFLDKKLGTSPLLLIIGTIFGIMAAFKNLYDNTKKDREK